MIRDWNTATVTRVRTPTMTTTGGLGHPTPTTPQESPLVCRFRRYSARQSIDGRDVQVVAASLEAPVDTDVKRSDLIRHDGETFRFDTLIALGTRFRRLMGRLSLVE